ncbi:MAG: ABC transporter permease [Acetobacteraceae bacterium]|nr:ABC transporter permease [Acetobacteraceae bacterium]
MSEIHVAAPAPAMDDLPGLRRTLKAAGSSSPFYMGVVLLLLVAFFSFLHPATFASTFNVRNIFLDASVLLILAVGTTYIMVAGGFDLSIGSVLVFSGVVAAQVMLAFGSTDSLGTVALGFVVALICGAAWGVFNGWCITRLRVSALISTLGTMGAALGGAYLLSDGSDIRTVPNALIALGHGSVGGVPWLVVITAAVTLVGGVVLHMTRFGRHTFLVGSNPEASRRAGINVGAHLLKLYALSGLLAGFAAMLSLGRFSTTTLEGHANDPLEAITAVVLGGTALTGGRGSIIGTVVGVFIPAVLANGFIIMGIQPFWQMVVIGFVVIAAVYADQIKRGKGERL